LAELQAGQREEIKEKHFAIPPDRYPIHDVAHARNALVRVRQHGTPAEKSKVYAAVSKKYPALATRSEVIPEKQQRKAEKKVGVGKGEESMKLEAPKQKISSVTVGAFADEVGQIKQAVSPEWVATRVARHVAKKPELSGRVSVEAIKRQMGGFPFRKTGPLTAVERAKIKKELPQIRAGKS
jgi:hypothetical protein